MSNQLQRLAMMHAALVPEIKTLAERFADTLVLVEAMEHQINAALASSDESPAQTFDQLGGFGFDRGPEPVIPEMAIHVPSTVPSPVETNEIGAIVQAVELPPIRLCDKDCVLMENHVGVCVNGDGAEIHVIPDEPMSFAVSRDGANTTITMGAKPKRTKTEYTAHEWAHSMHFLRLMEKPPFKDWPAEKQNAKRDEFVASVPADEKMNRWGQRFAKFCGVST